MRTLLVCDSKDYTDDMPVFERFCVRGVIIRDGKLAIQKSSAGDYKILGGGIETDEDIVLALSREVEEESGLKIIPESIREAGEILEMRRDLYEKDKKYVCHTWFYFCEAEAEIGETNMTESELAKGYHLEWATFDEIIEGNEIFMDLPWIFRDTKFVQMLANGELNY